MQNKANKIILNTIQKVTESKDWKITSYRALLHHKEKDTIIPNSANRNYALVVASNIPGTTGTELKNSIKNLINPSTLGIGINNMHQKSEKVIVTVPKEKDAEKLLRNINSTETPEERIIETIYKQNEEVQQAVGSADELKNHLKIIKINKNKHEGLRNVIIQTSPETRHALLKKERINIDFLRVHVVDQTPLFQCFKCLSFGHTRLRFTNTEHRCKHCARAHKYAECLTKSEEITRKCFDCTKTQTLTKTNCSTDHHDCPFLKKMEIRAIQNTDYGE